MQARAVGGGGEGLSASMCRCRARSDKGVFHFRRAGIERSTMTLRKK